MAIWIVLLALATYAGGLGTGWSLLEHVSYALGLVISLALIAALIGQRGVRAELVLDRHDVTVGEEIGETVTVEKQGWLPAPWLTLLSAETGRQSFLGLLGGQLVTWRRERQFLHRGRYEIGGDRIRARDPFGLFSLPAGELDRAQVTVYPREVPVVLTRQLESVLGRSRRPVVDTADASVGDLRQYVAGDPPSRIHWRSTARTGTLIVADPEPRPRRTIWLVVDLSHDEDNADRAAGIARYLSRLAANSGMRVGVIVSGAETVVVAPRAGTHAAILDALSRVPCGTESRLSEAVHALARADHADGIIVVSAGTPESRQIDRMRRLSKLVAAVSASETTDSSR